MTVPEEANQAAAQTAQGSGCDAITWKSGFDAGAAAERERIRPLLAALHALYDTVWNKTGTVEIDMHGYNGLSYDDTNAIDEAASAVEDLLAAGEFADLLAGDQP